MTKSPLNNCAPGLTFSASYGGCYNCELVLTQAGLLVIDGAGRRQGHHAKSICNGYLLCISQIYIPSILLNSTNLPDRKIA